MAQAQRGRTVLHSSTDPLPVVAIPRAGGSLVGRFAVGLVRLRRSPVTSVSFGWHFLCTACFMLRKIEAKWSKLKHDQPGKRFQNFRERERDRPSWVRAAYLGAALVLFAIGVVLVFIPGPAVVFFALAGGLLATQSSWVARQLDRFELAAREKLELVRAWWKRRGSASSSAVLVESGRGHRDAYGRQPAASRRHPSERR